MKKGIKIILVVIIGFFLVKKFVIPFVFGIISAPYVVDTVDELTQSHFRATSNDVAHWFENEYALAQFEKGDEKFLELCGEHGKLCKSEVDLTEGVIKTITEYVYDINVKESTVYIKSNGRACVKLVASKNGIFAGAEDVYSSGC